MKDLEEWGFLKNGLNTKVCDPEDDFSNGELQQLAVSRAFISMPTILMLDEATSAMHRNAIDAVYSHIQEYRDAGNCITKCDQIVCIKHDGSKHTEGTHDSLMTESECDCAVYIPLLSGVTPLPSNSYLPPSTTPPSHPRHTEPTKYPSRNPASCSAAF